MDPHVFLDNDAELAIDLKRFYDKRNKQIKQRSQMGLYHVANVTDQHLEASGVSQREFHLIKKLLLLDQDIFAVKLFPNGSPFTFSVDISKYE